MSQSVSVSTMQERVRTLCDLPAFTTTTPITSAIVLDYLQQACELLGGVIKEYSDQDLLSSYGTLSTQAGLSVVSTPVGFSDLLRLSWIKSANNEIPLERATPDQQFTEPQGGTGSAWSGWGSIRYRVLGAGTIELYPKPDAVYTLKLYYSTGIYVTAVTDTIVCRDGWSQWIALTACQMVRARQQKDASDFVGMTEKVEAAIRRQLKRDRWGNPRVRNVRGDIGSMLDRSRWRNWRVF